MAQQIYISLTLSKINKFKKYLIKEKNRKSVRYGRFEHYSPASLVYRTLHLKSVETMFSLSVHATNICHMLGHKTSLYKFQRIEIIQGLFSDHSKMKLEATNNKISGKSSNIWKFLLANSEVKHKITGEI